MRRHFFCTVIGLMVLSAILFSQHQSHQQNQQHNYNLSKTKPAISFSTFPLYFIENKGQAHKHARFYARTSRYTLWLTEKGMVFDGFNGRRDVSRLEFVNARKKPSIKAVEETRHKINIFKGNDRSKWRGNIPTSRAVLYKELYHDIDLKVYGIEKAVEYDWIVKPGGNPRDIGFRYRNVKSTRIDREGNLVVETATGRMLHKKPVAYQLMEKSKRNPVKAAFIKTGKHKYGFKIGKYDKRYELIIDPVVLAYSTYLGGSEEDRGRDIAVDNSGYIYVVGWTQSPDFPVLNEYQNYQAQSDVFVTKIDPTNAGASSLINSSYLGGSAIDEGIGVALDNNGYVYITGMTQSQDFPTLNPFQPSPGNYSIHAFVVKLDSANPGVSSLVYATYLGGTLDTTGVGIAADDLGHAYVTGYTDGSDFPLKNQFQDYPGGFSPSGFITKIDTTESGADGLVYSTYLGGLNQDYCYSIAIDNNQVAYVCGSTTSDDFPIRNGYQPTSMGGFYDGFITKIDTTLGGDASLIYSTFLGGGDRDHAFGIAADQHGMAYVTGYTLSTDFPILNQYQTDQPIRDVFVTKLDTTQSGVSGLMYSTYLGGGDTDYGYDIALDHKGNVYVTGQTYSSDFPTIDSYQGNQMYQDVFVTKIDPSKSGASSVIFSTYLGGDSWEAGWGVATDSGGNVYVAGETNSANFPLMNPYQEVYQGGDWDVFVAKLFSPVQATVLSSPVTAVTTTTAQSGGEVTSDGGSTVTARGVCWNTEPEPTLAHNITSDGSGTGAFDSDLTGLSPNMVYYVRAYATNTLGTAYGHQEIFEAAESYIQVLSPNGGESWEAGSKQTIKWNSEYVTGEVDIAYSTDGGKNWSDIIISTANDGNHPWTLPDVSSTQCLIHISETNDGPFDVSDGLFTIFQPSITITSPNGGEVWTVNTDHAITWNSTGSVGNVKIEYSINNGGQWTEITSSTANDGNYPWTVPGSVSNQCLVRISDTGGAATDTSDKVFSIVETSSLTVTSPNGGETLYVGYNHSISWTSAGGGIDNVKLEYSIDNGDNWTVITSSTPNDGAFDWTVPNVNSTICLVRASDASGGPSDTSDNVFTIQAAPFITLTSPNGGENLDIGTGFDISWTSQGGVADVSLYYSVNNGKTWRVITASTPNDGGYDWTVPDRPSDKCLVRVSGGDPDGGFSDVSDGVFTINSPIIGDITVTSPNGGEELTPGTVHNITWTSQSVQEVPRVFIEYSSDRAATWTTITASTPNATNGSYAWTVPNTPSDECFVRISGTDKDAPATDTSDRPFTISALDSPSIAVTTPNNGETWVVGDDKTITWTSTGSFNTVGIEYSVDNGGNWIVVTTSTENDGAFDWIIPDTPSAECLVRVSDKDYGQATDTCDMMFSIVPSPTLTLTSPNGGEQWDAGSSREISWSGTGLVGTINIEYSTDSGDNWNPVNASAPNTGTYDWTVPETVSSNCLVRVTADDTDPQNPVSDESDAVFSITDAQQASLTLTSPNGGEDWFVDTDHTITWTSAGIVSNVALEYSTNGGQNWNEIANNTPNDGEYDWSVPNNPSDTCLVRVRVVGGPLDISDAVFSILAPSDATLTLVSPNGFEACLCGSSVAIKWNSTGTINTVGLEYSTDSGGTWKKITGSTPDTGSYDWTVPDTPSNHCLVRVTGKDGDWDGEPSDESDNLFAITSPIAPAAVMVVFPNGGESLEAGSTQTINWTSTGNLDSIALDYSPDGGGAWASITSSTPDTGSYNWTVPTTLSDQCLIRVRAGVTDSDDEVSDVSDEVFSVVTPASPVITVQTPNGGEELYRSYPYDITWTHLGFQEPENEKVSIEFSNNGGDAWQLVAAGENNDGTYTWTVPTELATQCLIRISQEGGNAMDISDAVFSIIAAPPETIRVTAPNGGEQLNVGQDFTITWDSSGNIGNVMIEYSIDGGVSFSEIIASTPDDGSFGWDAPNTPSDLCRVRITGLIGEGDSGPADTSDGDFSINAPAPTAVRVISPNGGEQISADSSYLITWNANNLQEVLIEYSTDNGDNWLTVDTAPASTGEYDWLVPNTPSADCLIRITGNDGGNMPSDTSDAMFTIVVNIP